MLQRLLAMFAADATEADGAACLVLERNRTPKLLKLSGFQATICNSFLGTLEIWFVHSCF